MALVVNNIYTLTPFLKQALFLLYFLRFTEAIGFYLLIGKQVERFSSIQMSVYSLMDLQVFNEPEFVEWLRASPMHFTVGVLVKALYFFRLLYYVLIVSTTIYLYTKIGRISEKITRDPELNEPGSETQTIFNLNSVKQQTVEILCDISEKVEFL